MKDSYIPPPPLVEGDKVGIFVPASPVKEPYRSNGVKRVQELGYVPVETGDVMCKLAPGDFLAKTPGESFRDIQRFFKAREIKALWAGRGGYGSNHLLSFLPQLDIPEPKVVIGSSDVSYLLWYLLDHFKMVVFYGPMVYFSYGNTTSARAEGTGRFDVTDFTICRHRGPRPVLGPDRKIIRKL